ISFHPGNDELLIDIMDMCFARILSKDIAPNFSTYAQQTQLFMDAQFVTDLYAEVIGCIAQHRFSLVKRRFIKEFIHLKLNVSPLASSSSSSNPVSSLSSGASAVGVNSSANGGSGVSGGSQAANLNSIA